MRIGSDVRCGICGQQFYEGDQFSIVPVESGHKLVTHFWCASHRSFGFRVGERPEVLRGLEARARFRVAVEGVA